MIIVHTLKQNHPLISIGENEMIIKLNRIGSLGTRYINTDMIILIDISGNRKEYDITLKEDNTVTVYIADNESLTNYLENNHE